MAYTRKLPSGKHQGIAVHPSSGRKSTRAFPLKGQALKWAQEQEAIWRRDRGYDPRAGEMSFATMTDRWLAARVVEPGTAAKDEGHLRIHILPKWGRTQVGAIKRLDVGAWIKAMESAGVGPPTIAAVHAKFGAIMNAALDEGRIDANPAIRQRLPRIPKGTPRYFTDEQAVLILAELSPMWAVACDLSMYTGLRPGELLGLKVGAVDWEKGKLYIVGSMTRYGWKPWDKTGKAHSVLPIPPQLLDDLAPYVLGGDPQAFVFPAPKGGGCDDITFRHRVWAPAIKLAGACAIHRNPGEPKLGCRGCTLSAPRADGTSLPCAAHRRAAASDPDCEDCVVVPRHRPGTMRHTAATWLVEEGEDLFAVQGLLRHGRPSTTQVYAHHGPAANASILAHWEAMGARRAHARENLGARTVHGADEGPAPGEEKGL